MTETVVRRVSAATMLVIAAPLALFVFNQTGLSILHWNAWLRMPDQAPGAPVQLALALVGWIVALVVLIRGPRPTFRQFVRVVPLATALGAVVGVNVWSAAASRQLQSFGSEEIGHWAPPAHGLFAGLIASALIALLGSAALQLKTANPEKKPDQPRRPGKSEDDDG